MKNIMIYLMLEINNLDMHTVFINTIKEYLKKAYSWYLYVCTHVCKICKKIRITWHRKIDHDYKYSHNDTSKSNFRFLVYLLAIHVMLIIINNSESYIPLLSWKIKVYIGRYSLRFVSSYLCSQYYPCIDKFYIILYNAYSSHIALDLR